MGARADAAEDDRPSGESTEVDFIDCVSEGCPRRTEILRLGMDCGEKLTRAYR
jgi:hypothetical protein